MAIERDTVTTCSEYDRLLGIPGSPLEYYLPITRAGYKDQVKRGKIDGAAFLHCHATN